MFCAIDVLLLHVKSSVLMRILSNLSLNATAVFPTSCGILISAAVRRMDASYLLDQCFRFTAQRCRVHTRMRACSPVFSEVLRHFLPCAQATHCVVLRHVGLSYIHTSAGACRLGDYVACLR